ncbi:MAG: hypothetical protein JWN78_444 [Bacteroidota bacterium]|nr:hypothetical protein [Bacteroidota bacterium]
MKKITAILSFFFLISISFANDTLTGNWRGTIIGHTDNKDYFLNAEIESSGKDEYAMHLKVFSGDYIGEFLLNLSLKNQNRLYLDSFRVVSEFPFSIPHISDCFTGYFLVKRDDHLCELDLYRNALYRKTQDFVNRDTAGNYIPNFECFTTVLLHPVKTDTTFAELERRTDSIITEKKNKLKEVAKRKVISSKEWTVQHEKITLLVWDNNKEDGDIISLKFNDTWILNNFHLRKEKYTIHLELKQKDNVLLLFAENLGSIPPNTAAISIDDNEHVRTFMLNSDMSKSESVKIILQK